MDYITTVRLLTSESRTPLIGVKVALYDRDEHSPDDLLGTGKTSRIGEVDFRYSTRDFTDGPLGLADDGKIRLRDSDTTPDLYVIVYNANDEVVASTRDDTRDNFAAGHILILLDEEIVQTNHFITEA